MSKKIIPLNKLAPVHQKQILATLKKYSFEEHVLALLMRTMLMQLDEVDRKKKYIDKQLRAISKVLQATIYINDIVRASNKIWTEAFKELPHDVSISAFCKVLAYKRPKQYKKMNVNIKAFIQLEKAHAVEGKTWQTLKIVSKMLDSIEVEKAIYEEAEKEALQKIKEAKQRAKNEAN